MVHPVSLRVHTLEIVEMPSLREILLDDLLQSEPISGCSFFISAARFFDAALCPLRLDQILGLITHYPITPFLRPNH